MSPALIANVTAGANIRAFLRYDLIGRDRYAPRQGAELIGGSVPSSDPERIIQEFERVLTSRKPIRKPIYRVSLSLPAGFTLSPMTWLEVAEEWMRCMGMGEPGEIHYVCTRHQDTHHEHLHINCLRWRLSTEGRGPNGGGSLWSPPFP